MEGVMKLKYEHDSERWLRSQAKIYHTRGIIGLAHVFELCADDVKNTKAELAALKAATVHIYNSGYHAGHHYTVEGGYTDIHSSDMDSYHAEEVAELLAALVGEG
jgi:poly-gamma-glutamate capsule biosynthesis protein CapA/YwtB (metallophosphatase superfamily)